MNKHLKRIFSILLVFAICMLLTPQTANATTYYDKYKSQGTASMGKYVTIKDSTYTSTSTTYTDTYYAYKINVPADGYIKITRADTDWVLYLFKSLPSTRTKKDAYDLSMDSTYDQKVDYMAVRKGTYYLTAYGKTRFKVDFTKCTPTANYCRSKATKLSAGTTKTICMPKGYEYNRWYKITTTTKKRITVTFTNMRDKSANKYPDFTMYNAEGDVVKCPLVSGQTYRTATLNKGTYYICVEYDSFNYNRRDTSQHRLYKLKWK